MHHIQGAPRLTAQGHELMAELRRKGAALGHAFRAAELRYDALGGLTAEQARRRFLPGARWTLYGEPLDVVAHDDNGVRLDHQTSVDVVWSLTCLMKRSQGWRLVALAPIAPGEVSP